MLLDHYAHTCETCEENISLSYRAKRFGYNLNNFCSKYFGLNSCKYGCSYKRVPNIIGGGYYGTYGKYIRSGKYYMHQVRHITLSYNSKNLCNRKISDRVYSYNALSYSYIDKYR